MKSIFEKQFITILITDSGIGGLSVANYLYQFFQKNHYYKNVSIIYADSRQNKKGYNSFENKQQKIQCFSNRLFYLQQKIEPDIIVIACNTLSILLHETIFFKKCNVPIVDMINASLNSMIECLAKNQLLFITGTKTTIQQNYYKKSLIDYGFDKKLIINQMCPNLAKYIQASDETEYFIKQNVKWLVNRIIQKKNNDDIKQFSVSFNCTHYFYVVKLFKKYFEELGYDKINYICPNNRIVDYFKQYITEDRFIHSNVYFQMFQYKLTKIQKKKIKRFLNFNKFSFLI